MPILFSSKTPGYEWLSNFSAHPFTLDGVRWPSVEHYYQARKFVDPEIAGRIRGADTALKARKAGQNRSLTLRPDWDAVRENVMRAATAAKFGQNPALRARLLATGGEELVHESKNDRFWGRGADGAGQNRLGAILMELRQELRRAGGRPGT